MDYKCRNEIVEIIKKNLSNTEIKIKFDKSLNENEIDSLVLVKIIVDIELAMGIEFDIEDLNIAQYTKIEDLFEKINVLKRKKNEIG